MFDKLSSKVYICYLVFGIADLDITNYTDDDMPYTCSSELVVATLHCKNTKSVQ